MSFLSRWRWWHTVKGGELRERHVVMPGPFTVRISLDLEPKADGVTYSAARYHGQMEWIEPSSPKEKPTPGITEGGKS